MEPRRSQTSSALGVLAALFVVAAAAAGTACSENPVGRKCFINADGGVPPSQAIVSSPALECPSRTCLRFPLQAELPAGSEYANLCTAECTDDSDCDKVPESPCQTGFTCMVPVVVGPFCCRKMCVCKDYVVVPDGGMPVPAHCDPDNPENTCVNLPGR